MCVLSCWIVRATLLFGCGVAAADTCYPPGGVAGIVVATVIVTCAVGGLTAATAWKYWWTPRRKKAQQEAQQHRHQPPKSSGDFAFDNPYFRNQEGEDGAGKYKSSLNKNSLRSSKQSENSGKAGKKGRGGRNHFVFGGGKKQKALDDTCLAAVERTFVNLRGHDFTGLGFNICGNMRDGILVKDVLHRGPASESGLIKAGDKIVNVTVSFTNIVYEDALTILSYASPYDVQLEIERIPEDKSRNTPSSVRKLGSCSFSSSGQKLFHPLYRSQSIDDLTQIDREAGPNQGAGPRRSQSVGVAAHKLAAHFRGPEAKPEERVLSTTGSLNEKMLATVMAEGTQHKGGPLQWEKRFEDTLESDDSGAPRATPERPQTSKPKDSKQFLDQPPTRRTLETKMVLDESEINEPVVIRQKDPPVTDRQRVPPASRGRRRVCDEENDSDVSKDSLEVSHRGYQIGYQKQKKDAVTAGASSSSFTSEDNGSRTLVEDTSSVQQRVYANAKPATRMRVSSLSSNEDPSVYNSPAHRKQTEKQKPVEGTTTQSFGCAAAPNGIAEDAMTAATKAPPMKQQQPLPSSSHLGSYTDNRGAAQKFAKKPAPNPAGGMFTQINPFQMPSKQKHPAFKPRVFREEPNGDFPSRSVLIKQSRTDSQSGTYLPQH